MNEADRELLMLLGSVGIRVGKMVTGLFEDSLSHDEQLVFGQQLVELAEGFRERVLRTPIVFDGEAMNSKRGAASSISVVGWAFLDVTGQVLKIASGDIRRLWAGRGGPRRVR
jgi:hypothetical protein